MLYNFYVRRWGLSYKNMGRNVYTDNLKIYVMLLDKNLINSILDWSLIKGSLSKNKKNFKSTYFINFCIQLYSRFFSCFLCRMVLLVFEGFACLFFWDVFVFVVIRTVSCSNGWPRILWSFWLYLGLPGLQVCATTPSL